MARMNPMQRNKAKKSAQLSGQVSDLSQLKGYDLMRFQLHQHKQLLKGIASKKDKAIKKAELLPQYDEWIEGAMAGIPNEQDEVLATVAIWHCDAGNLDTGAQIGLFAIDHDVKVPDAFERNLATVIVETLATNLRGDNTIREDTIADVQALLLAQNGKMHKHNVPDQVTAKFFKAAGIYLEGINDAKALELLKLAADYDDGVGVSTKIKALERAANKDSDNG